jgi:hypothetical protein
MSPYGSFDPNEQDHLNKITYDRAPIPLLAADYQEERYITPLCCPVISKHFWQSESSTADDHINLLRSNRRVRNGKYHYGDVKAELYRDFPANQQYLNYLHQASSFQPSCKLPVLTFIVLLKQILKLFPITRIFPDSITTNI